MFDSFEEISSIPDIIKTVDCIVHTYKNNQITVSLVFNIEAYLPLFYFSSHLNQNIMNKIQNGTAVAACDVSVKDGKMGAYWVIMNMEKQILIEKELYSKS